MVVKTILSGEERLTQSNYQIQLLEKAIENLRDFNIGATLVLDSGQRITISKVLEGSDYSTRLLSVTIQN
ncbi:MAG: hypothetical protein WCI36_01855 [bacterium]